MYIAFLAFNVVSAFWTSLFMVYVICPHLFVLSDVFSQNDQNCYHFFAGCFTAVIPQPIIDFLSGPLNSAELVLKEL